MIFYSIGEVDGEDFDHSCPGERGGGEDQEEDQGGLEGDLYDLEDIQLLNPDYLAVPGHHHQGQHRAQRLPCRLRHRVPVDRWAEGVKAEDGSGFENE